MSKAAPILLVPAGDSVAEKGVGLPQWTQMTADLSTDTAGQIVSSATALDNLSTLESYDGLWIDLGATTESLTSTETANLESYIQTGRRVVMIGGDPTYATWDASLLSAVGGTVTAGKLVGSTGIRSYVGLTTGVSSLDVSAGGIAASGSSLFQDRVATTWGPASNALVLLDADPLADHYLAEPSNAQFASNVASWISGGMGAAMNWKTPAGGTWMTAGSWTAGQMPSSADTATFNLSQNANGNNGYTVALPGSQAVANVSVLADKVTLSLPGGSTLNIAQAIGVSPPVNQSSALSLTRASGTRSAVVSAGSISLGGNSGTTATLSVNTGVTLSAASATVAAGATVQVSGGALNLTGGITGAGALNQSSGSTSGIDIRLNSLTIGGGLVSIASQTSTGNGASASIVNSLSIATSGSTFLGTLDLSDTDLIVETGDLAMLTAALTAGYDGGKWDGPGIDSSAAADDPSRRTALGILQNSDGSGHRLYGADAPLGLFDGQDPAYDAILIKYTYYGDNDLSGTVTAADVAWDVMGAGSWATGDFNYDGVVDSTDLSIQSAGMGSSVSVPEPVLMLTAPMLGVAIARRRTRNARTGRFSDQSRHT